MQRSLDYKGTFFCNPTLKIIVIRLKGEDWGNDRIMENEDNYDRMK